MRAAVVAALGLAAAGAIVALFERFAGVPSSGRSTNSEPALEATQNPSAGSGEGSAVMALHATPRAVPTFSFADGDGRPLSLTDFRGRVVLLNVWATWCGPCREEMPTLDRLQAELGGQDFEVVALSIDRAGPRVVTEFYDEIGVEHLAQYIDESANASQQLDAVGLPTTVLIDREGREIARHVGPAEWDTPAMIAFLYRQIESKSRALRPGSPGKWAHGQESEPIVPLASQPILYVARLPATGNATSSAVTKGSSP